MFQENNKNHESRRVIRNFALKKKIASFNLDLPNSYLKYYTIKKKSEKILERYKTSDNKNDLNKSRIFDNLIKNLYKTSNKSLNSIRDFDSIGSHSNLIHNLIDINDKNRISKNLPLIPSGKFIIPIKNKKLDSNESIISDITSGSIIFQDLILEKKRSNNYDEYSKKISYNKKNSSSTKNSLKIFPKDNTDIVENFSNIDNIKLPKFNTVCLKNSNNYFKNIFLNDISEKKPLLKNFNKNSHLENKRNLKKIGFVFDSLSEDEDIIKGNFVINVNSTFRYFLDLCVFAVIIFSFIFTPLKLVYFYNANIESILIYYIL